MNNLMMQKTMIKKTKLIGLKQRLSTPFLNFYTLVYENRLGKRKEYHMVSKQKIHSGEELSGATNGVAMIVTVGDKFLLLREFRMAVNQFIYNLPAGMLEEGESIEDCARRELLEETGLFVKEIKEVLPASYGAVDVSNAKAAVVFLEAFGEISDEFLTEDEEIIPGLFTKDEIEKMLQTEPFSGRAQMAAWMFARAK